MFCAPTDNKNKANPTDYIRLEVKYIINYDEKAHIKTTSNVIYV